MEKTTLDPAAYVAQMAAVMELPLAPDHESGVVENFTRLLAIAQLVNEFPLPAEIAVAPVFQP